jgi:hypothetical protein
MPARPYRPSGKSEPGALLPLFLAALAGGVIAGVLEGVVGHYLISLVVIFPLLVGLAAGALASWRVGAGNVRAPALAAVAGLLGGLAGQATTHVMDYQFFRMEVAQTLRTEDPGVDVGAALDAWLRGETGSGGFVGFVKLQAREGVTIKRGSGNGIEFTGAGAYVLWVVELLLAAGAAAGLAGARAREPFCEHCRRWYDRDEIATHGGADRWKDVVAAVERGDAAGALAARGTPTVKTRADVHLVRCSRCEAHEPVLRIVVHTRLDTKKPKEKKVHETLVSFALAQALLRGAKVESEGGASGAA